MIGTVAGRSVAFLARHNPLAIVPVAILLSRAIGISGIWIAYPVTFATMFLLQMAYYTLVWRKQTVTRLI